MGVLAKLNKDGGVSCKNGNWGTGLHNYIKFVEVVQQLNETGGVGSTIGSGGWRELRNFIEWMEWVAKMHPVGGVGCINASSW